MVCLEDEFLAGQNPLGFILSALPLGTFLLQARKDEVPFRIHIYTIVGDTAKENILGFVNDEPRIKYGSVICQSSHESGICWVVGDGMQGGEILHMEAEVDLAEGVGMGHGAYLSARRSKSPHAVITKKLAYVVKDLLRDQAECSDRAFCRSCMDHSWPTLWRVECLRRVHTGEWNNCFTNMSRSRVGCSLLSMLMSM